METRPALLPGLARAMMRRPTFVDGPDWPADISSEYEQGVGFVRTDVEIPHLEQLSSVTCRIADRKHKKINIKALRAPLTEGSPVFQLAPSKSEASALQSMLIAADKAIVEIVKRWFPRYRWIREENTYRFTETKNEDFHWDIYNQSTPMVRAFVNLDRKPRVWGVGPLLPEYCAEVGDTLGIDGEDPIGVIAGKANKRFDVQRDGPTDVIEFGYGAVWLVQSQMVAHQIIYGRRMYACSVLYEETSMVDQSYSPGGIAKRIKRKLGLAA